MTRSTTKKAKSKPPRLASTNRLSSSTVTADVDRSQSQSQSDVDFHRILHHNLESIAKLSARLKSLHFIHESDVVESHIPGCARSTVQGNLDALEQTLQTIEERDSVTSCTAYAELSASLLRELEFLTTHSVLSQRMSALQEDNEFLKSETVRIHSLLAESTSRKDVAIQAMQAEKEILEYKNSSLIATVELLNKELERSKRVISDLQKQNVELHMQGAFVKGEIDRCSKTILHSVESQMGFVPRTIFEHIGHLRKVPEPGNTKIK